MYTNTLLLKIDSGKCDEDRLEESKGWRFISMRSLPPPLFEIFKTSPIPEQKPLDNAY